MRNGLMLWMAMVATLAVGGCTRQRVDWLQTNHVKLEQVPSERVLLDHPEVWVEDGQLVVHGAVARVPGVRKAGAGHTHVLVQDSSGRELGQGRSSWMPHWLPPGPSRHAYYTVRFPWVPPVGSSVRVWVCDGAHSEGEPPAAS